MSKKVIFIGLLALIGFFSGSVLWFSHWGQSRITLVNRSEKAIRKVTLVGPQSQLTELGNLKPGEKIIHSFKPKGEGSVSIRIDTSEGTAEKLVIGYTSPPHTEEDLTIVIDPELQIKVWEIPPACRSEQWIAFKRIYSHPLPGWKDSRYLADQKPLDKDEIATTMQVLRLYRIEFEIKSQSLFIPCKIWNDVNLMANVTEKSQDSTWLREHAPKKD